MFGIGDSKARPQRSGSSVDTLIGPQVVLHGELRFAGGLYLEGRLVGSAVAEPGAAATVTVAPRGRVEGELRAPIIVINGTVSGDVHAGERLELGPEARVEGNLHYALIEMAAGAAVTVPELVLMARAGTPPAASDSRAVSPAIALTSSVTVRVSSRMSLSPSARRRSISVRRVTMVPSSRSWSVIG